MAEFRFGGSGVVHVCGGGKTDRTGCAGLAQISEGRMRRERVGGVCCLKMHRSVVKRVRMVYLGIFGP